MNLNADAEGGRWRGGQTLEFAAIERTAEVYWDHPVLEIGCGWIFDWTSNGTCDDKNYKTTFV